MHADDIMALADYRRRVLAIYADVRRQSPGATAWSTWREERDVLFAHHPQSPIPIERRTRFDGLAYFPYDAQARVTATVGPAEARTYAIGHSSAGTTAAIRFGVARFTLGGQPGELSLFWLDQYGGGLLLPFRDATSGRDTYGGGRYLLDTAKGADLGSEEDGSLVLDFNFAYHPSCYHDPLWSCPLAPPENRLDVAVRAGERIG